jgi:hypothetical protein
MLALALCSTPALAGDYDGSRDLLCVPRDVADCDMAASCERVSAVMADVPAFIKVEFKKKQITSVSGPVRTTPIENLSQRDGLTILQGAQTGRAWSIVIDQVTGLLSASIADNEGAFAIFGACTPD